jgi:hypothetical protein
MACLSDETIDECTKKVIYEFINLITCGVSNKIMDGYNICVNSQQLMTTMGSAFLHDTMCEVYPEYIGTPEYTKSLKKINDKAYEFVKDSCETGLNIVSHHNYSKIKLAYKVIDESYGTQITQKYDEIKQNIINDLKSMEPSKMSPSMTNPVNDTVSSIGNLRMTQKEFNARIDKANSLTEEQKEQIKQDPTTLSYLLNVQNSVLNRNFNVSTNRENFKELTKTTGELGETAYLAGVLSTNEDLMSTGVITMNTAKVAQSVSDIINTGMSLANTNNILSAIVSLSSFFGSKKDPNAYLKSAMQCIQTMLQNIHRDMITNFNKVFKELGQIKTSIIVNFRNLDMDISTIKETLNLMVNQITSLDNKLTDIHLNITDQFNSLSDRLTLDDVSEKRTEFISKITDISMRDKDLFEQSMRELITLINVDNEALSGYKDIGNTTRMTGRLENLDPVFNINTLLEVAKKYSHALILPSDVEKFLSLTAENYVGIYLPVNKIQFLEIIHSESFPTDGIYPLYNQGIWSLFVKYREQSVFYGYSVDNIFDKIDNEHIHMDFFVPTNKSIPFCDSGLHICRIANTVLKLGKALIKPHQTFEDINAEDICTTPIKINFVNNPLCYAICLNEIYNQIEKQRQSDGTLTMGYMSGILFAKLSELIEKTTQYYDITLFFRNPDLIKSVFEDYKNTYTNLIKEIEIGKKAHFKALSDKLNLDYRTRMLDIIKARTEEYRAQTMEFKYDYDSDWFWCTKNHWRGKFAPADSRSQGINNPCDSVQHTLKDNYINHMRNQFETIKNKFADKIINIFTNQIENCHKSATMIEFIGETSLYVSPFIYHKNHKTEPKAYPILTMIDCNFSHTTLYEYQKLYHNSLDTNWLIELEYEITSENKFRLQVKINDQVLYSKEKDYEPLFYVGKEAIWFYWYGGNINVDKKQRNIYHRTDYYTDNATCVYIGYPAYTNRPESQFSGMLANELDTRAWYKLYCDNNKKVNEHLSNYSLKVQNKTLTTKLPKLMDEVDVWHNILVSMMKLGNMNQEINKIISESNYLVTGKDFQNYSLIITLGYLKFQKGLLTHYLDYANNKNGNNFIEYFNKINIACNTFNSQMLMPMTYINNTGVYSKIVDVIKETIPLVTSRYSPSDKEKWTQEMNEILIKILEVSQNNPDTFASFDLLGFIKSVKKSWEEKVISGTVNGGFTQYAVQCLLALPNSSNVTSALCL